MKAKSVTIFLIIVLILLVGCNSEPSVNNSSSNGEGSSSSSAAGSIEITSVKQVISDMSAIKSFKANVDGNTTAIGMQAKSDGSRALDDYLDNILVKQEEGKSPEPIEFEAVENVTFNGTQVQKGSVITQDMFPGTLDKVYVMGNYTFVSYLTFDAQVLLNSTSTQLYHDNGNERYEGNVNFNINTGNNGGESDNIWWSYYPSDNRMYVNYSHNRWWWENDQQRNDSYQINENFEFRSEKNDFVPQNENTNVSYYDTYDYYTSRFRQSFIIDNNTGLIYEIKETSTSDLNAPTYNFSIHNGVPIEQSLGPVSLSVNANDELVVEQIVANKQISILDVFTDKYGNNYILNDSFTDSSNGVVMFVTPGEYVPMKNGEVLHIAFTNVSSNNYAWWQFQTSPIQSVKIVNSDLSERELDGTESIDIGYNAYVFDTNNSKGLYDYNRRNNSSFWYSSNGNSGSYHYFSRIKDGKLYSSYSRDGNSMIYGILDLSNYNMQVFRYEGNGNYYVALDDQSVLVAERNGNTGNLYSLYVVSPFDGESGGFREYLILPNGNYSSLQDDYVEFLKKNVDVVGTSFGYNEKLNNESDSYYSYNWRYGEYTETRQDYKYNYYKKNQIGTSIGVNPTLINQDNVSWDCSDYGWHYIEGGVQKYDYEYQWYVVLEDLGTTFGYDPEKASIPGVHYTTTGSYRYGLADYVEESIYTYYSVNEVEPGQPSEHNQWGYYREGNNEYGKSFYYNGEVTVVGTSIGYKPSLARQASFYTTSDYGWHRYEGGIYRQDYDYVWTLEEEKGVTFGYDAENAAKGWLYRRSNTWYIDTAYYVEDYKYTYYEKQFVGSSFGYDEDLASRSDYYDIDYSIRDWRDRVQTGYSSDYIYFNYRDGDTDQTIRDKYYSNSNLSVDSSLLDDVTISNNDWRKYSDYRNMEFNVRSMTGSTSYKIVFDEGTGEYAAVKSSEYVAEKASLTLQPINK